MLWNGFPRGCHVLVADDDPDFLAAIKRKLQSFHYCVTTFVSGDSVLQALQMERFSFHIALLEAMGKNIKGLEILSSPQCIPIILVSSIEDMAITMQGIAAGAADFLRKPISDETLKNLWQHVARKAMKEQNIVHPQPIHHLDESTISMPHTFTTGDQSKTQLEQSSNIASNSIPSLATSQSDNISETKQYEMKCSAGENVNDQLTSSNIVADEAKLDDELESIRKSADDETKTADASQQGQHMQGVENCRRKERSGTKKKTKVDWNLELHRLFVQAVEELGLEKAIPSRILELMGVESLTRHNVASHLQKYRAQRKRKRPELENKCSSLTPLNKRDNVHIRPSSSVSSTYQFVAPGHVWGLPAQGWPPSKLFHQWRTASTPGASAKDPGNANRN